MLRSLLLVGASLLLTGCHQGFCFPGGFVVQLVRGEAEQGVYTLDFAAHFEHLSLFYNVECRTEEGRINCGPDEHRYSDPNIEDPTIMATPPRSVDA
jgi:hypothetical protein